MKQNVNLTRIDRGVAAGGSTVPLTCVCVSQRHHVPDPSRGYRQPFYGDDRPDWTGVHNQSEEECTDPRTTTGIPGLFFFYL